MTSQGPSDSTSGSLIRFFSNPVVGVAGAVASVIGVVLAVYFFVAAKEAPRLTYLVHPVRSLIVSAHQSSQLSVEFRGQRIGGDVAAAQVAFWNGGSRSIRPENVLRPFVIKVGGAVPILEARIRRKSRKVVDLELDTARLQHGEVGVTWNILERNDGGVVQLLFAGAVDAPITAEAVIEGQPTVRALGFTERIRSPAEQYVSARRGSRILGFLSLGMGGLLLVLAVVEFRMRREYLSRQRLLWSPLGVFVPPFVVVGVGIYFLFCYQVPVPPFGF